MFGDRSDLAAKQLTKEQVARRRSIVRHDVNQFMVHQVRHALAGRERLEGEVHWRDAQRDEVAGNRLGRRVARIGEVGEQDRDLLARGEVEQLAMERESVLKRSPDVRDDECLRWVQEDDADVLGLSGGELRVSRLCD